MFANITASFRPFIVRYFISLLTTFVGRCPCRATPITLLHHHCNRRCRLTFSLACVYPFGHRRHQKQKRTGPPFLLPSTKATLLDGRGKNSLALMVKLSFQSEHTAKVYRTLYFIAFRHLSRRCEYSQKAFTIICYTFAVSSCLHESFTRISRLLYPRSSDLVGSSMVLACTHTHTFRVGLASLNKQITPKTPFAALTHCWLGSEYRVRPGFVFSSIIAPSFTTAAHNGLTRMRVCRCAGPAHWNITRSEEAHSRALRPIRTF